MDTTAKLNDLRIAPRKVRIVVDTVRGRKVDEALNILAYTRKAAALPVAKLIKSALANAERAGRNIDDLVVSTITVDKGPTLRRFQPRAHGRAYRIEKKSSHVKVILGEGSGR